MPDDASALVGRPLERIDAPLKVSGRAMYASDHGFPGLLYAVPVAATVASGRVVSVDRTRPEAMPGVRAVYDHTNFGPLYRVPKGDDAPMIDERRPPLSDDRVTYWGQFVAVVVADTFEHAESAASAVDIAYDTAPHDTTGHLTAEGEPETKSSRGDPQAAFAKAPVKIDETYVTPDEVHNPIEAHACVAVWEGDHVTLYETVQAVMNQHKTMAAILGQPKDKVQVITRFLGSGFGGKLWAWTHSPLAAQAARKLGRPVKIVISRKAMFSTVGHRPRTSQRIRLSAERDGALTSVRHDYISQTSILDDYEENCGEATPFLYSTANLKVTSALARKTVGTPTSMRGPGAVPGLYALESGMDELALALDMDPVALRLKNEPAVDESRNIPFSSRHLKECLTNGAERFGWSGRNPKIGSMRRDDAVLGWGVAAAAWIAAKLDTTAAADLRADGTVRVACGSQDIGTGTYTMFAQVAGEAAGVPADRVQVVLGDSRLPPGPMSGGSMATASIVAPVQGAVRAAGQKLIQLAIAEGGPYAGKSADEVVFEKGYVRLKSDNAPGPSFAKILSGAKLAMVSGEDSGQGNFEEVLGKKPAKVSSHSFGCHFVEVTWRPQIARLQVSRVLTMIDAGRMINPKTARNQIEGAVVMGVGMALFEAMEFDQRSGAPINSNLADYVVATHADAPELDVVFLDYPDYNLNPLGAKGVGEIGLAGVAAAIANAVHHATGRRVRELPIRIEDLI